MTTRYSISPREYAAMNTAQLRENFLLEELFSPGMLQLVYTHYDRIIVGSAVPSAGEIALAEKKLGAEFFLERRELGVINIGGNGKITVDGKEYTLENRGCLYIGRGARDIVFTSNDSKNPAQFYLNSAPAHRHYPTVHIPQNRAIRTALGTKDQCNERVIFKYILPGNAKSCQLVMGLTTLAAGSVWNTMPCHTHECRAEAYLYFDIAPEQRIFHLMGYENETRHLVIGDRQGVLSPPWSIHSGVGTQCYSFIWGMCGENQDFDDMQAFNF
ncbi:MAG: 5-dehydro-4-deoxy-D-glucuronate isomerase [Oscillospiraceae bacterium]|nr:5-dehydro-4-deoxy-D-glucuronate isomerase [Oscillospiraceae bacterium]